MPLESRNPLGPISQGFGALPRHARAADPTAGRRGPAARRAGVGAGTGPRRPQKVETRYYPSPHGSRALPRREGAADPAGGALDPIVNQKNRRAQNDLGRRLLTPYSAAQTTGATARRRDGPRCSTTSLGDLLGRPEGAQHVEVLLQLIKNNDAAARSPRL